VGIEEKFNYDFTRLRKAKKENQLLKEELIKLKKNPQISEEVHHIITGLQDQLKEANEIE